MEKEDKGKLILVMLVLFPLMGWFIIARTVFQLDRNNALFLLTNTLHLKMLLVGLAKLSKMLNITLTSILEKKQPLLSQAINRHYPLLINILITDLTKLWAIINQYAQQSKQYTDRQVRSASRRLNAGAAGLQTHITDNILVRASTSVDSRGGVGAAAGLSIGF